MDPMYLSSLISLMYYVHPCLCPLNSCFIIAIHNDPFVRNSLFLPPRWEKSFKDFVFKAYFKYRLIHKAFPSSSKRIHTSILESLKPFLSPSLYSTVLEELSLCSKTALVQVPVLVLTSCMILCKFHDLSVPSSVLFCFTSKIKMLIVPTS